MPCKVLVWPVLVQETAVSLSPTASLIGVWIFGIGVWIFGLTLQYVLHRNGQLVLHVGQNVGISVQGDGDAGMAQSFANYLRILTS